MTTFAGRPVFPAYFIDPSGNPQELVDATVYEAGTSTLATLYADRAKSSTIANPTKTDSLANFFPLTDPGEYEVEVNGARIPFSSVIDHEDVPEPIQPGTLVQATGGGRESVVASSNSGAAATIDLSTGNIVPHTLTANCTFTMPTVTGGVLVQFTHELTQDATGSRTATYPASVKWPDGVAPILSTAAGSVDVLVFYTRDDGATWRGAHTASYPS